MISIFNYLFSRHIFNRRPCKWIGYNGDDTLQDIHKEQLKPFKNGLKELEHRL
jgi:hypothetical protein